MNAVQARAIYKKAYSGSDPAESQVGHNIGGTLVNQILLGLNYIAANTDQSQQAETGYDRIGGEWVKKLTPEYIDNALALQPATPEPAASTFVAPAHGLRPTTPVGSFSFANKTPQPYQAKDGTIRPKEAEELYKAAVINRTRSARKTLG